jgi:hypothetical protein
LTAVPASARAQSGSAGTIAAAADKARKRLLLSTIQSPIVCDNSSEKEAGAADCCTGREGKATSEGEVSTQLNLTRSSVRTCDLTEARILRGAAGGVRIRVMWRIRQIEGIDLEGSSHVLPEVHRL